MKRNLYSQFNFGGFTINDELYMKNLKKRVKIAQENYNKTELSKYVEFFNYFVTLEPKYKKILINALDNHIKSAKSMGSYLYPSYDDSVKLLIQLKK